MSPKTKRNFILVLVPVVMFLAQLACIDDGPPVSVVVPTPIIVPNGGGVMGWVACETGIDKCD